MLLERGGGDKSVIFFESMVIVRFRFLMDDTQVVEWKGRLITELYVLCQGMSAVLA